MFGWTEFSPHTLSTDPLESHYGYAETIMRTLYGADRFDPIWHTTLERRCMDVETTSKPRGKALEKKRTRFF